MGPMTETVRATVSTCGAMSQALLDEIAQRDPALRHDVERALGAGATLEFAVRFGEVSCDIVLNLIGPTGKASNVATISTPVQKTN